MNNTLLINQAIENSTLDKSLAYHTYKEWKNKGYQVQKGQKAVLSVQLWKKVGNRFVQAPSYLFSQNQVEEISKNLASKLNEILKNDDEKLESTDEQKVDLIEPKAEPKVEMIEPEAAKKTKALRSKVCNYELPNLPQKRKVSKKEKALQKVINKTKNETIKGVYEKDDKLYITDSRQLYILKSFDNELAKITESYPNIDRLIPSCQPKETITFNIEFIKTLHKTGRELKTSINCENYIYDEKKKDILLIIKDDMSVKLEYLINALNILNFTRWDEEITLEYYGNLKPYIIRKDDEIALISPIINTTKA